MATAQQGVYQIRCTVTGKVYVGSSARIEVRLREHRRALRRGTHHSRLLQRAWNKYGEGAFAFSVIEIVSDAGQLFTREQVHIDALGAADPRTGLNVYPRAEGPRGVRLSDARRQALREHMLALPNLAERVERMAAANRGRKLGPRPVAVGRKISAALTGRVLSARHRQRLSEVKTGKIIPLEQRHKMLTGLRAHFAHKPRKTPPLPKRFRMDEEVLRAGIILYRRGATCAELVPVLGFTAAGWQRALNRAGEAMGRRGSHPGVPRPTYRKNEHARVA